ncbi:radical SAM protein [Streptomyces sp. C10-9-1]|uniref:radical SAM protein n=1 Tax=Streptomyces sp. C10-9-1 TaxID=1859285 RepID=UPI003D759CA0
MELAALMGLRPEPAAGLLMMLTRRCPLRCAHCSTDSTMSAGGPDPGRLLGFVDSFTPGDRPEVLMMTGGEPLLMPELSAELAVRARRAGTRSALLTGAFFARGAAGRPRRARAVIPARIRRAIGAVDHLSVSVDAFHEREVARADVFRVVHEVLDSGTSVSLHVVGIDARDPYLADVTSAVREAFDDRVPMLVNTVRAVGRAAGPPGARGEGPAPIDPLRSGPCSMAAWPVVAADGTVVACCNQDVVDRRPVPAHLLLGHVAEDDWAAVRGRTLASPVLRSVRTGGPLRLLARHGGPKARSAGGAGYCAGCRTLSEHPEAIAGATRVASGAAGALLDRRAARRRREAGPVEYVRRHGCAAFAELVALPGTAP